VKLAVISMTRTMPVTGARTTPVKNPRRRYPSANDLADDLARFQKGEATVARPLGPAGRLWRFCRNRPRETAFGIAVLAALALASCGLGWGLWEWGQRSDRHREQVSALRQALDEAEAAVATLHAQPPGMASGKRSHLAAQAALRRAEGLLSGLDGEPQLRDRYRRVEEELGREAQADATVEGLLRIQLLKNRPRRMRGCPRGSSARAPASAGAPGCPRRATPGCARRCSCRRRRRSGSTPSSRDFSVAWSPPASRRCRRWARACASW
jgi:hypothetical protein